jgi:transposase
VFVWRLRASGRSRTSRPIWGCTPGTLRKHVRQAEADGGKRPDLMTSQEREEIRRLRKEVYELRRANEILKSASVFFAKELDPDRPK